MKNLFKHILFGAAIFAGMGLFVGCDMMTNDEIEKLIEEKLKENNQNNQNNNANSENTNSGNSNVDSGSSNNGNNSNTETPENGNNNGESSSNATADATPPVELAGTTWVAYEEWTSEEYDEDLGEYIEYEVYEEYFLHFTETTMIIGSKTYKKEDDSLIYEWETTGGYYVQGNIIIPILKDEDPSSIVYNKQKNCLYHYGIAYNLVEE